MSATPLAIDVLLPALFADRFTAGTLVLATYANHLTDRGHDVRVVATGVSERPAWIDLRAKLAEPPVTKQSVLRAGGRIASARLRRSHASPDDIATLVRGLAPHAGSDAIRRGAEFDRVRALARPVDVTIVTAATTVLPAWVHAQGRLVHHMQHYEPWFADAFEDDAFARAEAQLAHSLPMHRFAQVQWIADRVGGDIPVCPAGMDLSVFRPGEAPPDDGPFTVLSYGGSDVPWKGFGDAAEAIRRVRQEIPDLRWRVFGGAALPPDNDIAPYEDEGFVTGDALRDLYTGAHITLLPSWCEGFPYPPLESMACGTPVVSTPLAVADYGRDGENAFLVEPGHPEGLAAAMLRLARDPQLRGRLREEGIRTVAPLSWEASCERFETLLLAALDTPDPAAGEPGRLGAGYGPLDAPRPVVA